MSSLTLKEEDWEILKEKVKRKYNHLTDDDLRYTEGQEEALITKLAERIKRKPTYVLFTLKKGLASLANNRL